MEATEDTVEATEDTVTALLVPVSGSARGGVHGGGALAIHIIIRTTTHTVIIRTITGSLLLLCRNGPRHMPSQPRGKRKGITGIFVPMPGTIIRM